MWSRVSLWVMAPGRADRLDARAGWVFRVADAQSAPFSWKGVDYTTGLLASAPAYVDFELPPGIYVAWADLGALTTHRAALAVHDEPSLVVRLLPDVVDDVPLPEGECRITIDEVRGEDVRNGWPGTIVVSGTASSCPIVHVVIQREEAGGTRRPTRRWRGTAVGRRRSRTSSRPSAGRRWSLSRRAPPIPPARRRRCFPSTVTEPLDRDSGPESSSRMASPEGRRLRAASRGDRRCSGADHGSLDGDPPGRGIRQRLLPATTTTAHAADRTRCAAANAAR
jgi:hypothetical protein